MATLANSNRPINGDLTDERRRFIRLNINAEIKYSIIPQEALQYHSKTKDIGAGGICLLADTLLKTGDMLTLEISLPEDPPNIHAVGRVVWVKSFSIADEKNVRYDAGVEFTEITDPERKKINKYVFSLKLK